jgi:hypothetical protein
MSEGESMNTELKKEGRNRLLVSIRQPGLTEKIKGNFQAWLPNGHNPTIHSNFN